MSEVTTTTYGCDWGDCPESETRPEAYTLPRGWVVIDSSSEDPRDMKGAQRNWLCPTHGQALLRVIRHPDRVIAAATR